MKKSASKRLTRDDWLNLGLKSLESDGVSALTIERLCDISGKTRGSFYHHFSDHHSFIIAMLDYWREISTDQIIEAVQDIANPGDQRDQLAQIVVGLSSALENAIRGWSGTDERARVAIHHIDKKRLHFIATGLKALAKEKGLHLSNREVDDLAMLDYGIFIGVNAVMPNKPPAYYLNLGALSKSMLTSWMDQKEKL